MPDITMCSNTKCQLRKDCYRYKAKPSTRQSYAIFKPITDGVCDYYIKEVKNEQRRTRTIR